MAPIEFDRRKARTKRLEDDLTPAEVARLIRDDNDGQLRFTLRSLLESGQAPVSYVRESWSEDASYFTANRGATGLVVAFCSAVHRLGVPVSYFLQTMREDLYDVLVLRDPRKLHFDAGVQGLGSFLEVMHRIKTFAEVKGFREIITYGSSMGGYPALRAGLLLKANRAISMSGGYCWHVGRLIRKTKTGRAFDPLCPCFAPTTTELVAVIPSRNEKDVRAFEILQRTFPKCVAVKINAEVHTLPTFFYRVRLLRLFHACLFEYWNDPVRSELLTLVEQAAIHSDAVESERAERISNLRHRLFDAQKAARAERKRLRHRVLDVQKALLDVQKAARAERRRHARELRAIHASTSWRLTAPLRRLADVVRRLSRMMRAKQ